jgi:hypothetical protein
MAARKGRASAATVKVLVVTVVNALGVIIDKSGKVIRGLRDSETGQRMHPRDVIKVTPQSEAPSAEPAGGNTTVTALVINRKIDRLSLTQLARKSTLRWHARFIASIPSATVTFCSRFRPKRSGRMHSTILRLARLACDVA